MGLLSVNLSELMKEIILRGEVPASLQQEDATYVSNAVNQIKIGKQYDMNGQLEMNIFHTRKALRIIEQLNGLRGEKYPEY